MEFTTLPKTLGDFFDSLLPALTQTSILIAFIIILAGIAPITNLLKPRFAKLKAPHTLANDPFIKESGLLKLVPIGFLVAFLLLGIVIDRTVSFIGFKIPGQLNYSEPDVLVSSVPHDHLAKLWALFPGAADEYMLDLVLEYQAASAPAPTNGTARLPWEHHDAKFSAAARAINSAKFYVVLGLLICLGRKRLGIGTRRVWLRYLVILIVAAVLVFFLVGQQIEAKKQSDWAKVSYVVAKEVAGKEWEARLTDKDAQEKFALRLARYRETHKRNHISAFYIRP